MKYCPLMSFAKQYSTEVSCMGENCAFADADGDCLVGQALVAYVTTAAYNSRSVSMAIDKVKGVSYLDYLEEGD
jgi:hypothetical protein